MSNFVLYWFHECRLILPWNVSSHVTFLPHHFSFKMLSTFKPSAKSFCSDLDQVLFLPRLGQLQDDSFFKFVFAYPFFKSCIISDFISGVSVYIQRHTPVRTTEIWVFLISLKHFYHKIGMTDKFFALFFVAVFVLSFSSSFFFYVERNGSQFEATDLGWVFWLCM